MKKGIYLIVIIGFICSCQTRKAKDELAVQIQKVTCASKIELRSRDSVLIPQSFSLLDWKISGNKVILYLDNLGDFVSVCSYPEFDSLYNFGRIENRYGEFMTKGWCTNSKSNIICLYDLERNSIYSYRVGKDKLIMENKYPIIKDEDGYHKIYGKTLQLNDSVFLLQEYNMRNNLYLIDLKKQQCYDWYECKSDDEHETFSCEFDMIGNHVLLAYNHVDRLELLHINEENEIETQLIMSTDNGQSDGKYYYDKKDYYLRVCSYNDLFFCLKCNNNRKESNMVCVFDVNGDYKYEIRLDRYVNSITIDDTGNMVAYQDGNNGTVFYFYELHNGIY